MKFNYYHKNKIDTNKKYKFNSIESFMSISELNISIDKGIKCDFNRKSYKNSFIKTHIKRQTTIDKSKN